MKIVEKNNEISLRDIPAQNWAHGVLFLLGIIIFGGGALISAAKNPSQTTSGAQIVSLLVVLFLLYWAYQKLSLPATVTRLKPNERTVEITRRRFLIVKKTEIIKFSEIERFEVVRRKPERAFLYFTVLTRRDGSQIDLESDGNALEGPAHIIPVRLNELLKKDELATNAANYTNKN